MARGLTRRDAIKAALSAGTGVLLRARGSAAQSREITVAGRAVEVVLSAVSARALRLSVVPLSDGVPQPIPDDGSLVQQEWGPACGRLRVLERDAAVRCGDWNVKLARDPLSITIEAGGSRVQQLRIDAQTGAVAFALGQGPLLGLGQGGPQFDRRGSLHTMRSGQGGYQLRTHGGKVPVPWLIGTEGWALLFHHPFGTFDLTGAEGVFDPGGAASALPLDVFVVAAKDPAVVMAEYARLTGKPEMPPLWSLGYLQSHRTLSGPDEVLGIAKTFREKKLPCDALIYLGTEFTPSGWNTRNGEFEWHKGNFPEPKKMIDELHARHFKVVLHIVIEGRRMDGTVHDPCAPDKAVPSGRTPEGRWPEDRNVACYWPYHKPLVDLGVDGWWPDQGDGLDAASRLRRIRMYFEGQQLWKPNERPFALHRNGHTGMARYAPFLWSGDVYTTWETLRTHVSVAINTGLSGIPLWGTDIGGFVPTAEYTGELHVRWFQFGAFCPLFRAHGRTWHLRLPWGWNTGELGPDELSATSYRSGAANPAPSELRNAQVEPICRKYLELRYRLMPYLYSAVRETCETGLPIVRALWLHHPEEPPAVARGDEYLWGRDILVAPVSEKGAVSRKLYLPRGTWYDFWTEERVEGGREIERPVDLATIPLYVRAGAVVPFGPLRQYTAEPVEGPLTLVVHPGRDGAFTLYEDDGISFDFRRGEWMGLRIEWHDASRRLRVRLAEGSRLRPPLRRPIEARVAGGKTTRNAVFEGKPIEVRL
jgi:alpha-glucosidase/alpha-D-xyloside xylohydrolase